MWISHQKQEKIVAYLPIGTFVFDKQSVELLKPCWYKGKDLHVIFLDTPHKGIQSIKIPTMSTALSGFAAIMWREESWNIICSRLVYWWITKVQRSSRCQESKAVQIYTSLQPCLQRIIAYVLWANAWNGNTDHFAQNTLTSWSSHHSQTIYKDFNALHPPDLNTLCCLVLFHLLIFTTFLNMGQFWTLHSIFLVTQRVCQSKTRKTFAMPEPYSKAWSGTEAFLSGRRQVVYALNGLLQMVR